MAKRGPSRLHAFVGGLVFEWLLGVVYVIGLTLLFPFLYFLALPGNTSPKILTIAVVLILGSFMGYIMQKGTLARALRALSKVTLIPGFIGVLFSLFGKTAFLTIISPEAITLLTVYVDQAVPKVQALTIAYILLGLFLWYIANKLEKKTIAF
ncbi:hypothetical protein HY492_02855 [Candidatus Woesearchaeota archaeon]|nr:hypothetical protein [Candidatus Woesearchaeota archaeon]